MNIIARELLLKTLKKEMGARLMEYPDDKILDGYNKAVADFEKNPSDELSIVIKIYKHVLDKKEISYES